MRPLFCADSIREGSVVCACRAYAAAKKYSMRTVIPLKIEEITFNQRNGFFSASYYIDCSKNILKRGSKPFTEEILLKGYIQKL